MAATTNKPIIELGKAGGFQFTGGDGKQYKLTLKQRKFCELYMDSANGNARKAVRLAGYNVKNDDTARVIGYENLMKPHIRAYIELLLNEAGLNDIIVKAKHLEAILKGNVSAINAYYRMTGRFKS